MPLRPCLDCNRPTDQARCATCRSARNRARDAERGTSTQRGYDHAHQRARASWAPIVEASRASCARCHQPIDPSTPWDLDHTDDRTGYLGPSHAHCNRGAPSENGAKGRQTAGLPGIPSPHCLGVVFRDEVP